MSPPRVRVVTTEDAFELKNPRFVLTLDGRFGAAVQAHQGLVCLGRQTARRHTDSRA